MVRMKTLLAGAAVVATLAGCGGSVLQCRLDAVAHLPLEPDLISVGDVREVVAKVKACQAQAGDAGG
jgi:hypothetical protein